MKNHILRCNYDIERYSCIVLRKYNRWGELKMNDKVACKICGKQFKRITHKHLRYMHDGMTIE